MNQATGLPPILGIKHIIAVASGKGGVGKSTTAANLALALGRQHRVGLLDADIYGPNQPHMLGATAKPAIMDDNRVKPVDCYGLQTMSVGYLIEEDTPMIWRGPMVTGALMQLLTDTVWDNLDYLVIDLPPGTGDIQLTLAQKIPVNGVVIVTTPQGVALSDVRKAIAMFRKVKVPILGLIENMAGHVCSQCGNVDPVFGKDGGEKLAIDFKIPFLGQLPLATEIQDHTECGKPTVIAAPESGIAKQYCAIADSVLKQLEAQPKDYRSKFPKIVIEEG